MNEIIIFFRRLKNLILRDLKRWRMGDKVHIPPPKPENGWTKKALRSLNTTDFELIVLRDFPDLFKKSGFLISLKGSHYYLSRLNFPRFFYHVDFNENHARYISFEELLDREDLSEEAKTRLLFHLDVFNG